jgi:3-oxoacyl-[acyl-carrier-protein] synthase II
MQNRHLSRGFVEGSLRGEVMGKIEHVRIVGTGALSAMGEDAAEHRCGMDARRSVFQPIGNLMPFSRPELLASWIENRGLLRHRKWSPSAMAALHVARQAVQKAGWNRDDCAEAVLMFGTSRGGAAGWLEPWPGRRGFPLMAASNAMHGEGAAAVSIELGIKGAYQVISTGCSAGLDALGMAMMHLQAGVAKKALVVAADLPLVRALLDSYETTGILSKNGTNDPFHLETTGIFPAEAAAAIALEMGEGEGVSVCGYLANSDAADPLGLSFASGQLVALMKNAQRKFGIPTAICPHATGTASHAIAEARCLQEIFAGQEKPSLHLLKPYLGHGIGAGSLLETVILAEYLKDGLVPQNLPNIASPSGFSMPEVATSIQGTVWKIAASLGGHNSLVVMHQ